MSESTAVSAPRRVIQVRAVDGNVAVAIQDPDNAKAGQVIMLNRKGAMEFASKLLDVIKSLQA